MDRNTLETHISASLNEGETATAAFVADGENAKTIAAMARALADCFSAGGKVLSCGNGGSATDAVHFAEEFSGRFRGDRRALPALPLTDSGHLTCVGNDYGFDEVFARGVQAYGKPGDILVGISTSGNSKNIIRAVEEAKKIGMTVFVLTGKKGGPLAGMGDYELWVKSNTTERVQEIQMMALHIIVEGVERIMFPENY